MDSLDDWFEYALDLPDTERRALLARLRTDDPELARRLEDALTQQVTNADFLCRASSTPATRPEPARLVRVTLPVDDVAAAVRWYRDVFGCGVVREESLAAVVALGEVELQLVARGLEPSGLTIRRYRVTDLGPGELRPDGSRALRLVDPWGNPIEVVDGPRHTGTARAADPQ